MAVTVTVPPSTTKLIALADLKAILGITDSANDALLGNIIQRGSDVIARFCNRVFVQRTIQETLRGPGSQLLKLGFSPVVTLTSICVH
jgi:hypothetical protein